MALFYNPVKIHFGINELDRLAEILKPHNYSKVLLLTGASSLKESGYLGKITDQLSSKEVSLYSGIPSNPDVEDLIEVKNATDRAEYDLILAVGGGSVIDAGKVLAAFKGEKLLSEAELRQAIQEKKYLKKSSGCPLWAVPTTAGTGSEVTSWATVWDKATGVKHSVEHLLLYPEVAIIEPALTLGLSKKMTASSALDALSHATEAYWSKKTNEIVRMYAVNSISLIAKNLADLLDNPQDLSLRTKVAYGSLFAGLAFSNTKTTACHSISYPLTLGCDLDHGIAVCMTLGKMLIKNEDCLIDKDKLLQAYGISHVNELEVFIQNILEKAGIPSKLREYGVSYDELDEIANKSFTPGRMDNNPADIDRDFILSLLENIY